MAQREPPHAPGEQHMKPGDHVWRGTPGSGEALCPDCGGSGKLDNHPCETCEGTGIVIEPIGGA